MASIASRSAAPGDLRVAGNHSVRIGDSIRDSSTRNSLRHTSLRFNHRPTFDDSADPRLELRGTTSQDTYAAVLSDADDVYNYEGEGEDAGTSLILMPDDSGDGWTLEAVDTSVALNLVRAPWSSDRESLQDQYAQLDLSEGNPSPFKGPDEHTADDTPDTANPFDFRNHISSFSPSLVSTPRPSQHAASPALSATSGSGTPLARARKPMTNPMMQRKPLKTNRSVECVPASKRRKSSPDASPVAVPLVRVSTPSSNPARDAARQTAPSTTSRRTSGRSAKPVEDIQLDGTSDEDQHTTSNDADNSDGDLVMDDASSMSRTSKLKPGSHTGLHAPKDSTTGPISLRSSAAASPRPNTSRKNGPRNGHADIDLDLDPDVETLTLPGPAASSHTEAANTRHIPTNSGPVTRRRSSGVSAANTRQQASNETAHAAASAQDADDADEDDELEQEMLRAMMAADEDEDGAGTSHGAAGHEEEEESEEE